MASAKSAFRSAKLAMVTRERAGHVRDLLLARGASALPPDLAAAYMAAQRDVSARHKHVGLSVVIDLGLRLLEARLEPLEQPDAPGIETPEEPSVEAK